ncbi:MAG: 2-amino-4-hydroxy-6-hydroxymethyldihydropteridine diphosphokinase [Cohaesibacter sp.]|jgi:2-amino-4-hydroxy-6-hydroxymethyldihydropteridine diphosphokinase|nr:2-amino-4-hydroxy-6-hydroxymethyldihydropteridine diphosphokinase [Cohaesibacter sp.]
MTRAYLSLGGNIGDPGEMIGKALDILDAHPAITVLKQSAFYKTPPWGNENQAAFINACAEIETSLSAQELLAYALKSELDLGRIRKEHWGPRVIDIDLLTFGDAKIDEENLTIPHPFMMERAFVLVPLQDIAPAFSLHDQTIDEALEKLDLSGIERL